MTKSSAPSQTGQHTVVFANNFAGMYGCSTPAPQKAQSKTQSADTPQEPVFYASSTNLGSKAKTRELESA